MKKLLSLGLIAPLAAAGALSVSSAASAASFLNTTGEVPPFNQLSVSVNFDVQSLNYTRVGVVPGPPVTSYTNPLNLAITGYGTAGNGPLIDFNPQAINVSGTTNIGGDAFTICNTGGTNSTNCGATITDFIADGTGTVNPFINVLGSGTATGLNYDFSLDKASLSDPVGLSILKFKSLSNVPADNLACASNPFSTAGGGCAAQIDFAATGKMNVIGAAAPYGSEAGNTYNVTYSYAGPDLVVDRTNSTNCGSAVGNTCTINFFPTTGAGNLRVTVNQAVPEPGTVGALLGLGTLGLLSTAKRKKLGK